MLETLIQYVQSVDPIWVYAIVFAIAFIENVFPPSPSDTIIVLGGSLVGIGRVGFAETLLCATAGSTLGFVAMYKIGQWSGNRILEQGKIKFIPVAAVNTVERWFQKHGYWLIVANRFLSGTRAVVSFFAGMSELKLLPTTLLSAVSALAWNAILVTAGYFLGRNWERIGFYLSTYSQVVTGVLVVVALIWLGKVLFKSNSNQKSEEKKAE
ncbi:MAG: DedA family protein [Ignavibacteriae bacterium]|nr:DedA family protein [Ignavibacteriota bacterium]